MMATLDDIADAWDIHHMAATRTAGWDVYLIQTEDDKRSFQITTPGLYIIAPPRGGGLAPRGRSMVDYRKDAGQRVFWAAYEAKDEHALEAARLLREHSFHHWMELVARFRGGEE